MAVASSYGGRNDSESVDEWIEGGCSPAGEGTGDMLERYAELRTGEERWVRRSGRGCERAGDGARVVDVLWIFGKGTPSWIC